jgi:hypothetical protein
MAQKQKGVADAVIKAKLHTPYQNLGIVSDQRLLRRIVVDNLVSMETVSL